MTSESISMIVEPIRENGLMQVSSEATTGSPEASSTASDSPTPANSVHEKNWPSHWQGLGTDDFYFTPKRFYDKNTFTVFIAKHTSTQSFV